MTPQTVVAAPASRIAHRPAHRDYQWHADGRRIALAILEPADFDSYNAAVDAAWRELPGQGYGSADISGPIADALTVAINAHGWAQGANTVWVADTAGRTRATSAYPFNGSVRVSG
mgnify:FL=1